MSDNKRKSDTFNDFAISWQLFKENWKAFLSTILFAYSSFIFIILSLIGATFIVLWAWPQVNIDEIGLIIIGFFRLIILFLVILFLQTFLSCQYGLAYDIMSSGDMFAEFKSAFHYYNELWWQYVVLSLFLTIPTLALSIFRVNYGEQIFIFQDPNAILIVILQVFISITWQYLWILLFPAATSRHSLRKAFKENIYIIKHNFPRVFKTFFIFFSIFELPSIILAFFLVKKITINGVIDLQFIVIAIILIILIIVSGLIGTPIKTLLVTRIYNSIILIEDNNNLNRIGRPNGEVKEDDLRKNG
ncbi:MAG: hypothetical protein ACTSU2_07965 [Promethearchaeota archaeon]